VRPAGSSNILQSRTKDEFFVVRNLRIRPCRWTGLSAFAQSQNGDANSLTRGTRAPVAPVVPYSMWTRGLFNMLYTQLPICRRVAVSVLKVCKAQRVLEASRSGISIALL
jgi:hypothetical protein